MFNSIVFPAATNRLNIWTDDLFEIEKKHSPKLKNFFEIGVWSEQVQLDKNFLKKIAFL